MKDLSAPKTAEDYMILVRQIAAITNKAMDYVETHRPIERSSLEREWLKMLKQ